MAAPFFKPTTDQWSLIHDVAFRGASGDLPVKWPYNLRLECRVSYNVEDSSKPTSINMMLVSNDPYGGCGDCDLADRDPEFTKDFKKQAPLNDNGDGLFDFYIYNRYDPDNSLYGNVLVEIRAGALARIWIEGGNDWSWTPETGIVKERMFRRA